MKLKLPSPSMVVAFAALAVSLTGTGVAAVVLTGANIKDGTIAARDLTPKLQARIGRAGAPGPAGGLGLPGAPGGVGAAGVAGAAGMARAWAHVNADGSIAASLNILSANPFNGVYCVVVDPSVDIASSAPVVTVIFPANQAGTVFLATVRPLTQACPDAANSFEVFPRALDGQGNVLSQPSLSFNVVVP